MTPPFDLQGIVEYALRREVMAWRTYERLAEVAPPGAAQAAMHQLTGFEVDHVRQYTEVLRPQIEAAGIDPDVIVERAESDPLDMGGYVDEAMLSEASLEEVLRAARGFEQAMARFYAEAAGAVEDEEIRGVLERLSAEEESHDRFVKRLLDGLQLDPDTDPEEFPAL